MPLVDLALREADDFLLDLIGGLVHFQKGHMGIASRSVSGHHLLSPGDDPDLNPYYLYERGRCLVQPLDEKSVTQCLDPRRECHQQATHLCL